MPPRLLALGVGVASAADVPGKASVVEPKTSYNGPLVKGKVGPNCTLDVCLNAENLCGEVDRECHVLRRLATGEELWRKVSFAFREGDDVANPGTGPFKRKESGYFSKGECLRDEAWMEFAYEGKWDHIGPSYWRNGSSLGSITIDTVALRLLKDKVCTSSIYDDTEQCLNTLEAMKVLCPCNGWDWSTRGEVRERDVAMFCQPREECPLINDVFLNQVQYFAYNASADAMCMSEASLDEFTAHRQAGPSFCVYKNQPFNCYGGALVAWARRSSELQLAVLALIWFSSLLGG